MGVARMRAVSRKKEVQSNFFDEAREENVRSPEVAPTAPAFSEAPVVDNFQAVLGNTFVNQALGGVFSAEGLSADSTDLAAMVRGDLTLALGGVQMEAGFSQGSNLDAQTAMSQAAISPAAISPAALRDAREVEDPATHAPLRLDRIPRSGGEPLPAAVAQRMGAAFEHDFSHVRIHTGPQAAQAARDLNAYAFSIGPEIWFGGGTFAPGTPAGDRLLAHELTHVVQHDEGRIPQARSGESNVSHPSDPTELEAESMATRVAGALSRQGDLSPVAPELSDSVALADAGLTGPSAAMDGAGLAVSSMNDAAPESSGSSPSAETSSLDGGAVLRQKRPPSGGGPGGAPTGRHPGERPGGVPGRNLRPSRGAPRPSGGNRSPRARSDAESGRHPGGGSQRRGGDERNRPPPPPGGPAPGTAPVIAPRAPPGPGDAFGQGEPPRSVDGRAPGSARERDHRNELPPQPHSTDVSPGSSARPDASGLGMDINPTSQPNVAPAPVHTPPPHVASREEPATVPSTPPMPSQRMQGENGVRTEPVQNAPTPGAATPDQSPGAAGPGAAGPGAAGPGAAGPGAAGPGTSGPATSGPGTSGPGTSGPGTSGPGTSGPGTSGPGTSGGTSTGTAGGTTSTGSRELDNLVDYYMETHWDRSEFDSKVAEFGVTPEGFGTELDRWMPATTPTGVRSALNVAFAVQTGLLDAMIIGAAKSIPGVGILANIAYGVRDIWKSVNDYGEVDDTFGMVVQVVRGVVDVIGGIAGNISDTCSLIEDAAALTIVGAPVAGVAAAIGEVADAIGGPCDIIKFGLDIVSLTHNVLEARRLEAEGNFRAAAKHRELASGDALNLVVDGIAVVSTAVSALSANAVPGEVAENAAEAVRDSTQMMSKVFTRVGFGALGIDSAVKSGNVDLDINLGKTIGEATNRGGQAGMSMGGLSQSFNNLKYQMGLGDAMGLSTEGLFGGRYIQPNASGGGTGPASGAISQAREASIASFEQAYQGMTPDPLWYQKLINDMLNPPGATALDTYTRMITPSEWIKSQLGAIRGVAQLANDLTAGGVASLLNGGASILNDLAQPAVDAINAWIAENKPAMDEFLLGLTEAMQQQQVTLQSMRDALTQADSFVSSINDIANQGGSIHQFTEQIISSIEGMQVNQESLGIPDWMPEVTYKWAIDRINGFVQSIANGARQLRDQALSGIDSFVEEQTAWAQARINEIQNVISEGGEVETMLQQTWQTFSQSARSMAEIVANWDGQIDLDFTGAADWLTQKASEAEASQFSERLTRFKDYLTSTSQPYVDDWKSQHGPSVQQAYHPQVPEGEVRAADTAYNLISERIQELIDQANDNEDLHALEDASDLKEQADDAYATVQANAGGSGREAINAVWGANDQLATLARALGL